MGILEILEKWKFPFLVSKMVKDLGIPIFCSKNDQNFVEFPCFLDQIMFKKEVDFWEFPMKNVGKTFGIPMSSLACLGVSL